MFPVAKYFPCMNIAGSLTFKIPYKKNYIKQSDWMDKTTRERAQDKVAAMISHIAYPDELLDEATLERFYEKLQVSENHYFESILNVTLFNTEYSISQLRKPLNKTEWISHGKSAVVNAFYSAGDNSIREYVDAIFLSRTILRLQLHSTTNLLRNSVLRIHIVPRLLLHRAYWSFGMLRNMPRPKHHDSILSQYKNSSYWFSSLN